MMITMMMMMIITIMMTMMNNNNIIIILLYDMFAIMYAIHTAYNLHYGRCWQLLSVVYTYHFFLFVFVLLTTE